MGSNDKDFIVSNSFLIQQEEKDTAYFANKSIFRDFDSRMFEKGQKYAENGIDFGKIPKEYRNNIYYCYGFSRGLKLVLVSCLNETNKAAELASLLKKFEHEMKKVSLASGKNRDKEVAERKATYLEEVKLKKAKIGGRL